MKTRTIVGFARTALCISVAWPAGLFAQNVSVGNFTVDPSLAEYRRGATVVGKLNSVGSSALTQLINRWGEGLKKLHPDAFVEVTGGGSASAVPALIEGRADIAPMSRPMTDAERAAFKAKFSYEPTQLTVGIDALAIYVNKNNPLKRITLKQLDALYSVTLKRGGTPIKVWGDLGLTSDWAGKPIHVFGPQSTQGMYGLFRADILQGGEYRYDMRSEPVASAIVQGVGADDLATGFASHVLGSARARAIAVASDDASPAVEPTQETVSNQTYPLARGLFIYINQKPGTTMAPLLNEFIRLICSKQGQEYAAQMGNYPLPAQTAKTQCWAG